MKTRSKVTSSCSASRCIDLKGGVTAPSLYAAHIRSIEACLEHDDTVPNRPHAVLALCSLKDLRTIDRSATRLGDLCRLRARELFQVAAHTCPAPQASTAPMS